MMQPQNTAGSLDRGFTLLELLTVVAIISILLLVALPAYQQYQARSRVSEALYMFDENRTGVEEYYYAADGWPANNSEAGLSAPTAFSTDNVVQLAVGAGGTITVTMRPYPLAGKTIVWTPSVQNGSVVWDCTQGGTVPTSYRPGICR